VRHWGSLVSREAFAVQPLPELKFVVEPPQSFSFDNGPRTRTRARTRIFVSRRKGVYSSGEAVSWGIFGRVSYDYVRIFSSPDKLFTSEDQAIDWAGGNACTIGVPASKVFTWKVHSATPELL
jgi:hypothetical protein